jgi:hypothetical protein
MKNIPHYKLIEEKIILLSLITLLSLTFLTLEKTKNYQFKEITGEVVTLVNVSAYRVTNCNFTVEEGLNLVSFFCIPIGISRDLVIGNITELEAIFEYQEGQEDSWKTYNPNLPSFVIQDLNSMTRTEGYWIIATAQQNVYLSGGLRVPTDISISKGWNLVGYPTNKTKSVNESFVSIQNNFTEARTYNAIPGVFINYIPGVGGGLTQTEPYKAYWINATTAEVWHVD